MNFKEYKKELMKDPEFVKAYEAAYELDKIVKNMPEEIWDFIKELENRWVPGSFGAGF